MQATPQPQGTSRIPLGLEQYLRSMLLKRKTRLQQPLPQLLVLRQMFMEQFMEQWWLLSEEIAQG